MARTKHTERKKDTWDRRRQQGSAHKHGHLNQWSPEDMKGALREHGTTVGGTRLSIRGLAKKYNLPYATLYKRISGEVRGTGYMSGGRRVPKVFTAGMLIHLIH